MFCFFNLNYSFIHRSISLLENFAVTNNFFRFVERKLSEKKKIVHET